MKTSLAIVLAAAALMVSATVSLKSGAAIAGYSNKSPGLCGVVACPNPDQAPIPWRPGPGPYRGSR
jgi:hypothetical protein